MEDMSVTKGKDGRPWLEIAYDDNLSVRARVEAFRKAFWFSSPKPIDEEAMEHFCRYIVQMARASQTEHLLRFIVECKERIVRLEKTTELRGNMRCGRPPKESHPKVESGKFSIPFEVWSELALLAVLEGQEFDRLTKTT